MTLASGSERMTITAPDGPCLVYVDSRSEAIHIIDADVWSPDRMTERERLICRAVLTYALGRLNA